MLVRSMLLAVAACLAGSAAAAPCGPYTVAMYGHGALYYRSGEQWAGIDKDIVDELARRTGCELHMTAIRASASGPC
jgi:polar amino acid transport system substrate-binding protein